jgi:hypothetical protein
MPTPQRTKARKAATPPHRIKGETVQPTNTLLLIERIGVTRAHRELGVSTTTLHKARKSGVVSRVVEIAATAALQHLGAPARASAPQPFQHSAPADRFTQGDRAVFLISVPREKANMVEQFARMLDAEIVAH